ncbi:MAG TPA: TerC family protein [Gemmataceae bacterium]|jgi:predicted tellurium resistance membrane protein TerC|nr:TerC family protein [Gemmataceae bacterium]
MVEAIVALVTLTAMEIVLGIDNIIFIAIVAGRLPPDQQPRARRLGLAAALITRLLLLATLSYILKLNDPLFTLPDLPLFHELEARAVSIRDLILIGGGLFLIAKSTVEIHERLGGEEPDHGEPPPPSSFASVIIQIAVLDIIFSLDSVITAVGMVNDDIRLENGFVIGKLWIMSAAVVVAVGVMLLFAGAVSDFVARHPTLKILALSFLILIGVLLVAEGLGQHINKGYIYFAMAFSVAVEMLNLRLRPHKPVKLGGPGHAHLSSTHSQSASR